MNFFKGMNQKPGESLHIKRISAVLHFQQEILHRRNKIQGGDTALKKPLCGSADFAAGLKMTRSGNMTAAIRTGSAVDPGKIFKTGFTEEERGKEKNFPPAA